MSDDDRKPAHTVGPAFFASSSAGAISDPTEPTETHVVAPGGPLRAPPPGEADQKSITGGNFSNPGVSDYSGRMVGPYKLIQVIGQGGMGQVYLAEHVRLGRRVALKMLRPEYALDMEAVKRFFGEARAVNQISHDHIIEITDFIEEPGQPASFIMEYLEGETLADIVYRHGRLSSERLINIASQVTSAMAAVHDAFMIHRDLKPENIFLTTRDGRTDYVKLLDFGVAKLTESKSITEDMAQTQAGVILGTPDYMAPEQFEAKPLDHRVDIYALGVILYEMATGRKPFEETSIGRLAVATLTKTATRPLHLEDCPRIPQALDALIMQCLEKSPDLRPQHMANIEERLAAISRDLLSGVAVFESPEREDLEALTVPKSRLPLAALAFGALAIAGGVAAFAYMGTAPEPVAPVPLAPATPETVDVAVSSVPEGVEVFIRGESIGKTPLKSTLPYLEGFGTLRLVKEGYAPQSHNVRLDAPIALSVSLNALEPAAPVASKAKSQKASSKTSSRTKSKRAKKGTSDSKTTTSDRAEGKDVPTKSNVVIKRKPQRKKKKKTRESLLDPFAQ